MDTRKRMKEEKRKVVRQLFLASFSLSAFTFGGGYVIIGLLKQKFVDQLHWIDEEEMLDLVAIAQSAPGPIAVNGAIVVGYKLGGFPGILAAVLGAVLPPFLILLLLSFFYRILRENSMVHAVLRGMSAGVGALIVTTAWDMAAGIVRKRETFSLVLMAAVLASDYLLGISPVCILLAVMGIGLVRTLIGMRREGKKE